MEDLSQDLPVKFSQICRTDLTKCGLTLKNMGTLLTSNRTALLFLVKEIQIQTPNAKSNPNSMVKEQQAGLNVQSSVQLEQSRVSAVN